MDGNVGGVDERGSQSRVRAVITILRFGHHNTICQHLIWCISRLGGNASPTYIITCVDFSTTNEEECCD